MPDAGHMEGNSLKKLSVPDTLYLKQVLIEERQESEWAAGIGASPTMQLAGLGIKLEQNRRKLIQSEQLPHISLSATSTTSCRNRPYSPA